MAKNFEILREKMSAESRARSHALADRYRQQLRELELSPVGTAENNPPVPLAGKRKPNAKRVL